MRGWTKILPLCALTLSISLTVAAPAWAQTATHGFTPSQEPSRQQIKEF